MVCKAFLIIKLVHFIQIKKGNIMSIKITGFVLIALFLLTVSVYAQEWPSVEVIVEKIQEEMNLTKEQFDKVKLIIKENMAKRKEITPQLAKGLTQAQSASLDAHLYTKLSKVLTRKQMRSWNKILELMLQENPANQDGG
ncbi:MAG: hypothetical protein A2243_04390 [Omnitrophica WOR_2 bacterium RIFOXYA2_FULL_38_17]|nr:MAG: hypothetical protein A2243_04390 [Omnitrophica WOR_2 bacterium RIFOXYA2_FULL_38_17]OGX52712.1 MAG: hypothetical protein A2267_03295 [Omnitrophica WOR_2 bacterium RIFOXYA12_FULL_38_10]OGX59148.1 MAG: hypothetical protein A2447_12435 [Omnitrophica WOR_2 bacterium RIFOXYC2_FULL_38_12]HBG60652.1 hypothetical protein [Candidatus Omnitrophota bacterium]